MRQSKRSQSVPEGVGADVRVESAAHHEAGHIVIAAAQHLRLRPEGLSVDPCGHGLACYCKVPDECDLSREHIIIATFAGYEAQKRFCLDRRSSVPTATEVIGSPDWREAREVLSELSDEYCSNGTVSTIQEKLENRSDGLVKQNWPAIAALATALLAKPWEPLRPLGSGSTWSHKSTAKYVVGEEAVIILGQHGISAVCVSEC